MGFFKSYRRGVNDGLKTSGEGSGFVFGLVFPILVTVMILAGLAAWWGGCFKKKAPRVCRDYSYTIGLFDDRTMKCDRGGPGMIMRIERRRVKSDVIHCTCPREGN